jgi:hypothetical protein
MLVDLARGLPVAPSIGRFQDGLWMTNYESSVFLEASRITLAAHQRAGVGAVA